jgi:hypothetical protein
MTAAGATVCPVTGGDSSATGLVPVHVGLAEPGSLPLAGRRGMGVPLQERSALTRSGIDWHKLGVRPRWLGMESFDCSAALEPGYFDDRGASERDRYVAGASRRGEMALLISMISDAGRTPMGGSWPARASVPLLEDTCATGRLLPSGTSVGLAEGLSPADRDLGLRLRNRPPKAWWALGLEAPRSFTGGGVPILAGGPIGILDSVLVDPLGAPVVAAWVPAGMNMRWYILPDSTEWTTVIDWLIGQALPAYVPEALGRARSTAYVDPDLQTATEAKASKALADLEERYAQEKKSLEEELRTAEADAGTIRDRLLYGTAGELVEAVALVLTAAGFQVRNLDIELSGTKSADLLAITARQSCLIEVKSASGNASESLVGDLQRHLATWPRLQPGQPVTSGALIVNHQRRKPPRERAVSIYTRPEFAAALPFPVLSTRQLFNWWRSSDWDAIHDAILGQRPGPADGGAGSREPGRQPATAHRAWWRSRRPGNGP